MDPSGFRLYTHNYMSDRPGPLRYLHPGSLATQRAKARGTRGERALCIQKAAVLEELFQFLKQHHITWER